MIETLKDLLERALTAGIGHIAITDPGRPAFERLASTCCDQLGATCIDLVCDEPLIDWPGAILPLRGRLLELTPVKNGESELKSAMMMISKTQNGPKEQIPSMGCNIKWIK